MTLAQVVRKSPLIALVVSSLVLNVALTARVSRQQAMIKGLTPLPLLKIGDTVDQITGTSLTGKAVRIRSEEGAILLYVYSASCGWCERNGDNMREMVVAARRKGLRVYALALQKEGAQEFLAKHSLDAEVVIPSDESREKYHLGSTPQTLIVGADAKLLKNWRGALVKKTAEDVEEYLDIKLPGLLVPAASK